MERAFPKTLLRRKNIAKRGGTRLPLVGNEGGKKIGKNLSYPLTGAGLLMEDAEAQRNLVSAASHSTPVNLFLTSCDSAPRR